MSNQYAAAHRQQARWVGWMEMEGRRMDEKHEQRMHVIFAREQAYRQLGVGNIAEAHDAIDYLYTCVRLLENQIKQWQDLGESGMGIICNSQPDVSLDAEHRDGYQEAVKRYLDEYHAMEKQA